MTGTKRLSESDFWLPKPAALGWRGLSLLIPSIAAAVGFFCFAVLAFGFTELETLPAGFRRGLVITGAFALAFGSEIGTLSNVVEIYRKGAERQTWDWLGLVVSVASTFASFVLAFAALLGVKATWGLKVQLYGPLVLGVLAALDAYGGFMEFGLYLNSHDARMKQWRDAYERAILDRVEAEQRAKETERRRSAVSNTEEQTGQLSNFPAPIEAARAAKVAQDLQTKEARLEKLLTLYQTNPDIGPTDMARRLDVSRSTVYTYLNELEDAGRIKRNGEGVQVLTRGLTGDV
jgi:DNA-binding transcriptional ArsR family regulator